VHYPVDLVLLLFGFISQIDSELTTFPVEIGKGVIDLRKICVLLDQTQRNINLTIEDHGGEFTFTCVRSVIFIEVFF
jgi:hypothetical protein